MAIRDVIRLSPGLADAGLSSLGGFLASLYAVRMLEGPELGAFALYLSASLVGGLVPQQLLYLPAQVAVLGLPPTLRLAMLPSTLLRGALLPLLVLPLVAVSGLVTGGQVGSEALVALGAGAVALTLLAPMQDHLRSTLYLAERPGHAALLSGCQLVATAVTLGVLHASALDAAWVPLTSLAAGAGGSLVLGLLLIAGAPRDTSKPPETRDLLRAGRPLLPAALLQEGTVFAAAALLVALTSAATLGAAEAARIVSRPLQTLSLGVSRSLAPRLMESGHTRSRRTAREAMVLYASVLVAAGGAYTALAGWPYPASPFEALMPAAYEKDGLVALFFLAMLLGALSQLPRGVLIGAGRGGDILRVTVLSSGLRLGAVVLLAGVAGAYALPLAHIASIIGGGWAGARAANRLLDQP